MKCKEQQRDGESKGGERERVRYLRNEDRGRTKRDSDIPACQWSAGRRVSRRAKREIQGETKVEKERKKEHGGRRMIFISDLGCVWFCVWDLNQFLLNLSATTNTPMFL